MKKFIALFLAISFLLMNCAMYKRGAWIGLEPNQKPGALLIIQQKDGDLVGGELIAVKENSLLLLERDSGADVTVDIEDISVIKINNKSKAGVGLLAGGAIGAFLGYATYSKPKSEGWITMDFGPGGNAAGGGILGGLLGLLIGATEGTDETIQIEGKSASEIKEALEKLRKKARVTNFQ